MTELNYTTTITLSQEGKHGPISTDLTHTKRDADYVPEVYTIMTKLAALWAEILPNHEPEEPSEGEPTYVASFTLAQEGPGKPMFSTTDMTPKIQAGDEEFPDAYGALSVLVNAYLTIVGIIDDNGDIVDDEALDERTIITALQPTLH